MRTSFRALCLTMSLSPSLVGRAGRRLFLPPPPARGDERQAILCPAHKAVSRIRFVGLKTPSDEAVSLPRHTTASHLSWIVGWKNGSNMRQRSVSSASQFQPCVLSCCSAGRRSSGKKMANIPSRGRKAHSRYTATMPQASAARPSSAAPMPAIPKLRP